MYSSISWIYTFLHCNQETVILFVLSMHQNVQAQKPPIHSMLIFLGKQPAYGDPRA